MRLSGKAKITIGVAVALLGLAVLVLGLVRLKADWRLITGVAGGGVVGLFGGMKKAAKKDETERLQDEADMARGRAEEAERAKIENESGHVVYDNLSVERRERIAKAGRDAAARVLARRKG